MRKKLRTSLFILLFAVLLSYLASIASKPDSGVVEYQIGVCLDLNGDQKCTEKDVAVHGVSVDLYLHPTDQQPKTTVVTNAGGLVTYTFAAPFKNLEPVSKLSVHEVVKSGNYYGCPPKGMVGNRIHNFFNDLYATWTFQDVFPIPLCSSGPSA